MLYRSMTISAFGKSALEYATYIRVVPAPTFSGVAFKRYPTSFVLVGSENASGCCIGRIGWRSFKTPTSAAR
jgi:hypothetical protein